MKYIDAEKLKAEIERLKERAQAERVLHPKTILAVRNYLLIQDYDNLLSFITSLQQEQSEVDLEKEWKNLNPTMLTYAAEVFGGKTLLEDISYSYRRELADYFNGLVKAARKEK